MSGSVRIGPAAFRRTPGWLASTIGHEVEIHVNQQAMKGRWWTDTQGTAIQEVQAYQYEIRSALRFGVSVSEYQLIRTGYMPHYYNTLNSPNRRRTFFGIYSNYTP